MKNLTKLLVIIALVAVIGFAFIACDTGGGGGPGDGPGPGPQKATYVSTDSNGNKYTLEINESGGRSARSAAQTGDTFKLTVDYTTAFGGGSLNMKFEYSGTVGAAQTSGATVSLTLDINGETITITIVGTQMTVITGKIVNKDGEEVVDNPGPVTPVDPNNTHTHSWGAWQSNETQHWRECTADDGATTAVANHTGNPCTVCGYSSGPSLSLDGVWRGDRGVDDHVVTISGSTGVFTQISSMASWQSAINNGNVKAGDQKFRNLTNTGGSTWTGQELNASSSGSVSWGDCTITLSADALSFQLYSPGTSTPYMTYTKTTLSLDGVWQGGRDVLDHVVTISGSTGVFIQISSSLASWQSAVNKGNVKVGDQKFRNLTNTGGSTWTGQQMTASSSGSVSWDDCTITLSADALSFQLYSPGTTTTYMTYYRR
jgi:hypothetical protein